MTTAERIRLVKLLGLLGSDHAGERDNAARAAQKLVTASGLTWNDLLTEPPPFYLPQPIVRRPSPQREAWRDALDYCIAGQGFLCKFDRDFLRDVEAGHYGIFKLSRKAQSILDDIVAKVREALAKPEKSSPTSGGKVVV